MLRWRGRGVLKALLGCPLNFLFFLFAASKVRKEIFFFKTGLGKLNSTVNFSCLIGKHAQLKLYLKFYSLLNSGAVSMVDYVRMSLSK